MTNSSFTWPLVEVDKSVMAPLSARPEKKFNLGLKSRFARLLPYVGLIALVPVIVGVAVQYTSADIVAMGNTIEPLLEMQTLKRRMDGQVFQMQGLAPVSETQVRKTAGLYLRRCDQIKSGEWLKQKKYESLRRLNDDFCHHSFDNVERLERLITVNRILTKTLEKLPDVVTSFDGDTRELEIERFERTIRKYVRSPDEEVAKDIMYKIGTFRQPRYEALKFIARMAVEDGRDRGRLIQDFVSESTNEESMKVRDALVSQINLKSLAAAKSQSGLLALSAIMTLLLSALLYRLHRASLSLANLNQTLEKKVDERTVELTRALEQLNQQQSFVTHSAKMSALGEMAGGIAHEINTPLAAIALTAEMMAMDATASGQTNLLRQLETITSVVERISKIVKGLKRFSRSDEAAPMSVTPVSQIIDDTLSLCSEKLKARGVVLEIRRYDHEANVNCSPEQISQVLVNLLNNAFDAVEATPRSRWIRIETSQYHGQFTLKLIDGGKPISDSVREKLMQPFFTTKQIGKGTGLGLSISKGIMLSHNGTLEFDAHARETTFVMTMPAVPDVDEALRMGA